MKDPVNLKIDPYSRLITESAVNALQIKFIDMQRWRPVSIEVLPQ